MTLPVFIAATIEALLNKLKGPQGKFPLTTIMPHASNSSKGPTIQFPIIPAEKLQAHPY